ncbi:MAG: TlpA disulfide reductase family protein [Polyangiales bacterium]|nr:redoxin domain-containing protein [Myxococcales bacterium]
MGASRVNMALSKDKAELIASVLAALVGVPLLLMFVSATVDGQRRAAEAPLRSMFGDKVYGALAAGESSELHYIGNDRTAPDFTLMDKDGKPWSLKAHRGKVVLLNFWSITCQPCVEEMPSFLELGRMLMDRKDVEVVAVSVDSGWEAVSTLFPSNPGITVLFDPDKSTVRGKFGTRLYPETWLIDADGVIRMRYDGAFDWSSALVLDLIRSVE